MHLNLFLLIVAIATTFVRGDSCNPLKSNECPADPALASSFKEDFSSKSKYFKEVKKEGLSYGSDGLTFKLAKRFQNPTIQSNFYIMFGKVEVQFKAAEGKGIVSSFYLQSDDLDEVDIEWFGGDKYQYQSNYFSKGNTSTYDRGKYHSLSQSPLENFITYTLDWTEDSITWSHDGNVDRVLYSNNSEGYPQTPMYLKAGVWAGGDPSNQQGTIEWAGGETDYSQAPFSMYIKNVIVTDYSTGSKYSYDDQSGKWSSIKAANGKVNGRQKQGESDFEKLSNNQTVSESYSAETQTDSSLTDSSSESSSDVQSSSAFSASTTDLSSAESASSSSEVSQSDVSGSATSKDGSFSSASKETGSSPGKAEASSSQKTSNASPSSSAAAARTTGSSSRAGSKSSSSPQHSGSIQLSNSGSYRLMSPILFMLLNALSILLL